MRYPASSSRRPRGREVAGGAVPRAGAAGGAGGAAREPARAPAGIQPDLWLEDKGLSLVIHARLTPDPDRFLEILRAPVGAALAAAGLGVRPGKEVLEICIPGLDKGTAIRELLGGDPAAAFSRVMTSATCPLSAR